MIKFVYQLTHYMNTLTACTYRAEFLVADSGGGVRNGSE
jgi:hypothetical protein